MLFKQFIKPAKDVLAHIVSCHVKHQLVAQFVRVSVLKMVYPIGVRAVKVAVGVDHFRLYPKPEIHALRVDVLNQFVKPVREFFFVHIPIAQSRKVVVSLAEPTVVHNKKFNAYTCRRFRKRRLIHRVYVKIRRFPRIVKHR